METVRVLFRATKCKTIKQSIIIVVKTNGSGGGGDGGNTETTSTTRLTYLSNEIAWRNEHFFDRLIV